MKIKIKKQIEVEIKLLGPFPNFIERDGKKVSVGELQPGEETEIFLEEYKKEFREHINTKRIILFNKKR